ncbi:glyoxalase [Microbulbifer sp. A4B17]|nr:glyoxalase [Microbulbifer sp. A4B17]
MISHTTLGTNDLGRAEKFFDELLPLLNGKKLMNTDRAIFYSFEGSSSKLAISKPFDQQPASQGNGTMVAFSASSINRVKELHTKAISLGAKNEGEPGERYDGLYYGAYFRDPDGNKFSIFCLLRTPST